MQAHSAAIEPHAFGHRTMLHCLERRAQERGDAPALVRRRPTGWEPIGWRRYAEQVQRFARGLEARGIGPGDRVAILAGNRVEWVFADLGAMAAGAVPFGIYPSAAPEQIAWLLEHAGAAVLVVDSVSKIQRLAPAATRSLRLVVHLDEGGPVPGAAQAVSFDELVGSVDLLPAPAWHEALDRLDPDALATLVYTSGTTGHPKGVMLTHQNLVWTAERLRELYGAVSEESTISYLPLAHVAEQMATIHLALVAGAKVHFGHGIESLREDIAEVRPTMFLGVPRVWEKFEAGIRARLATASTGRRLLFSAAQALGGVRGGGPIGRLAADVADRAVFARVRAALGFDRLRFAVSSTAPIRQSTLDFFQSIGIPIHQVYGQSETSGPATLEVPHQARLGSVGKPLPGMEVRLAPDGEILLRGQNVFLGYDQDPDATAEALDGEGWLHTGDVGRFDTDGFLWITGRKKELIATAGGKKVAPVAIEALLGAIRPVAHALVVGEGRRYLGALLTLDPTTAADWARERGLPFTSLRALAADPRLREHLARSIGDEVNAQLARPEQIKRFVVLPSPFEAGADGELTPTLKLRRQVALRRHAATIESLYLDPPPQTVTACTGR